jgi:hypothetical protein
MDRARGRSAGRRAFAIGTHWKTHQRRISHGGLDSGCQHHDPGAGFGGRAVPAARGGVAAGTAAGVADGIVASIGGERGIAVTAPDFECSPGCAGGGQKAIDAEALAHLLRAGSACARSRACGVD